ncbi:MAG: 50S ribosomal protein L18 [Spirochaetia bacterium]|nr:50S ribosomal protein L18 [Spirochaetia bacterium]
MKHVIEKRRKRLKRKVHIRKRITGTPERPRMSVFRSNNHVYVQVIDDTTGRTIAAASNAEAETKELRNSVANAAKIGELIGSRLNDLKITEVVFDRNGYLFHGIVKSIADGARKTGIKF